MMKILLGSSPAVLLDIQRSLDTNLFIIMRSRKPEVIKKKKCVRR